MESVPQLRFVSFDELKVAHLNLVSRWYRAENADFYYFETMHGELFKFQCTYYGQIVEWTELGGLRTGCVEEIEQANGNVLERITFDEGLSSWAIGHAKQLIAQAEDLPLKQDILSHMEKIPSQKQKSFWKRFLFGGNKPSKKKAS